MIIVLTENGTAFVNEKEFRSVWHFKEGKQLIAYYKTDVSIDEEGDKIEKVISVHYYSDSEEVEYIDEGNDLTIARQDYSKLLEEFDKLRKNYFAMETENGVLSAQVNDLKRELAKYEAK